MDSKQEQQQHDTIVSGDDENDDDQSTPTPPPSHPLSVSPVIATPTITCVDDEKDKNDDIDDDVVSIDHPQLGPPHTLIIKKKNFFRTKEETITIRKYSNNTKTTTMDSHNDANNDDDDDDGAAIDDATAPIVAALPSPAPAPAPAHRNHHHPNCDHNPQLRRYLACPYENRIIEINRQLYHLLFGGSLYWTLATFVSLLVLSLCVAMLAIAWHSGQVTSWLPYVSDAGTIHPTAAYFSILLTLIAALIGVTIVLRSIQINYYFGVMIPKQVKEERRQLRRSRRQQQLDNSTPSSSTTSSTLSIHTDSTTDTCAEEDNSVIKVEIETETKTEEKEEEKKEEGDTNDVIIDDNSSSNSMNEPNQTQQQQQYLPICDSRQSPQSPSQIVLLELSKRLWLSTNRLSIIIALFGIGGLIVASNFRMSEHIMIHLIGASVFFIAIYTYGGLQLLIEYKLAKTYHIETLPVTKLILFAFGTTALIGCFVFSFLSMHQAPDYFFNFQHRLNWSPQMKGFWMYHLATATEWITINMFPVINLCTAMRMRSFDHWHEAMFA